MHYFSGGASLDAAITVQCCDMLTLLCNRPNICNILGSSITLLLRTLSLMTSSGGDLKSSSQLEILDKVREVLAVLLKDCTSHEFLPIVRFNDEELDRRYEEYTSRPLLSAVCRWLNLFIFCLLVLSQTSLAFFDPLCKA